MLRNYLSPQAYESLQAERARRILARVGAFTLDNPADFIEQHFIIPETGGPLPLHPEQRAVLTAMSTRNNAGDFLYTTWVYSAPKKSAKTTIGAGVALWQAWQIADGQIYIIGNDQKQADNRMMQAIRYAIDHHPTMRKRARVVRYTIYLDNGTRIESIPVDPRGEAGMNPTGLFWTEAWGAIGDRAELLWTEAALSPTRAGKAFKFIESYAGYTGESLILERLYMSIVRQGAPHASVPELYTNGGSIAYWCTRRFLPWQVESPTYYEQEAREKTEAEFNRLHNNQWASSSDAFIAGEWWDACKVERLDDLGSKSLVLSMDAAVSGDCFAIVGVSRSGDNVEVRYVKTWTPPAGGKINFAEPEAEIRRLCAAHSVLCVTYDPYQLHDMATRLSNEGVGYFEEFTQGASRLVSDKRLRDVIISRRIQHAGEPTLREHLTNAGAKAEGEHLRIVKRTNTAKIDAAVALSMATDRAYFYNIG